MSKCKEWLILLLIAVFSATFIDYYSPLNNNYSGDFAVFMMFAQSWAMGDIPFVEVFDHKGPFHFVVYLLGVLIGPEKWGVYIINILWQVVILKLIVSIIRSFIQTNYYIEYCLLFVVSVFLLLTGIGFTCEVVSLPFILLPLYLTSKFWSREEPANKHPLLYSFIYGICIAIVFLIRPNNGVVNCGLIIGFIIHMLLRRNFIELFLNGIILLGGFLTIVAPTLLYFYSKGALWAMIDDAYIFNIVYLGGGSANVDIQSNIVKMLPAFYVILLSLLYDRKFHVKYSFI